MVNEAKMLYQVCREMIPRDSPVASIGDEELQFFHTFFEHIDTERAFCGLRPVSDGNAVLWTSSKGSKILQTEAEKESDFDSMYETLEASNIDPTIEDQLAQKDKKIHELESVLNALEEELGNGHNGITKPIPAGDEDIQEERSITGEMKNNELDKEEQTYESRIDEGMGILHNEVNETSRDGAAMSGDNDGLGMS